MPTIKVTEEEYQLIHTARQKLAMQGLNKLRPAFQKSELSDMERFTLGTIVGIGALLLIKELNK